MPGSNISSPVKQATRNELKAPAAETHQKASGLLTEAIRDYVTRKRVRPSVLNHRVQSIAKTKRRESAYRLTQ